MTLPAAKPTKKPVKHRNADKPVKVRKPRPGTKSEKILTLATSTPNSATEIAEIVDTSRDHIYKVLNRYGIDYKSLDSYKKNKADILAGIQDRILQRVNTETLKKASINNLAYAYSQFHTAERLERDQSTDNVAVMTKLIDRAREYRERQEDNTNPIDT